MIPKIFVANIYIKAVFNSPILNKLTASKAKLENVVKPPRIPMIKNIDKFSLQLLLVKKPINKPINRDPIIFTANVFQINTCSSNIRNKDNRYLNELPIAPPNATNSIFCIFSN